jgi:hypothetical protein
MPDDGTRYVPLFSANYNNLASLLHDYQPSHTLRSSTQGLPRVRSETGQWTFAFSALTLCIGYSESWQLWQNSGPLEDSSVWGQMTSRSPRLTFYPRVEVLVGVFINIMLLKSANFQFLHHFNWNLFSDHKLVLDKKNTGNKILKLFPKANLPYTTNDFSLGRIPDKYQN